MGVKCLAQEHNTVPRPELEPGPFDPESSALTIRPPLLPHDTTFYVQIHETVQGYLYKNLSCRGDHQGFSNS